MRYLHGMVFVLAMALQGGMLACGPYFPVSFFPSAAMEDGEEKHPGTYGVRPHLGAELAMIGAHYYSEWRGKAPKGNRISTKEADRLDFFSAGESSGAAKESLEGEWKRFSDFCLDLAGRLEKGERVDLPGDIPNYALEFYLYKLGHANWLVFRKDEDPEAFGRLLSLPRESRLYRTVWVHFVRIANAKTFSGKDRHVLEMRKALDAGYRDTAGLEAFLLRFLYATCRERYEPLVLCAYMGAPVKEWPLYARRIFTRRQANPSDMGSGWFERLVSDRTGIEIAVAHGLEAMLPEGAYEGQVLGADRRAWHAFGRGDLESCRKLLKMAPKRSMIVLFLEARLARMDGDYEKSAAILHEWLKEYRSKSPEGGYAVSIGDPFYWLAGTRLPGEDGKNRDFEYGFPRDVFSGTVNYTGSFGPKGFFGEPIYGAYFDYPGATAHEPTLPRILAGELGVVMVARRDLEEALNAFLLSGNWLDVAFVAERCMTADELASFLQNGAVDPYYREPLCALLMRRLVRLGRLEEALRWAPAGLKPLCAEYCGLMGSLNSEGDEKAIAHFNLARLVLLRGMELMGTELRPDAAIFNSQYPWDALPVPEPSLLPGILGMGALGRLWTDWESHGDSRRERFHYRRVAISHAMEAAVSAKDNDVRAWSLMLGGVASLSLDDAQAADWFYKRLARMRHPEARVGKWLSGPVYSWFRTKYYLDGKRRESYLVPRRIGKEELASLKAPKEGV